MAQPDTLTDDQVRILRWIADGRPDGFMPDTRHRITAATLRRRGLARVTGRGPTWKAAITKTGTEYLAAVDGPTPPIARQANQSVAQQLVDEILAAGGTLRVPKRNYYDPTSIDYERRAQLAKRHGKIPAGMWLEIVRDRDGIELRIDKRPDGLADPTSELIDVPVPTTVKRYHPAARRLRDKRAEHTVSQHQLGRAIRIVHAIATEADRRGWNAEPIPAGLAFQPPGLTVTATIKEPGVHTRGPWEEQVRRYRDYTPWLPRNPTPEGPYDKDATGKLEITVKTTPEYIFSGRQSKWGDRQAWQLEDRIPHLFQEIATRIVLAEHDQVRSRLAAEHAAEQARIAQETRERQWQIHMAEAHTAVQQAERIQCLLADATSWATARRIREYCTAVEALRSQDPATQEYVSWARAYATSLDPLTSAPHMPEPTDPTPEELQEHMPPGWSVKGPGPNSPWEARQMTWS